MIKRQITINTIRVMKKLFVTILMLSLAHVCVLKAANTDITTLDNIVYVEPFEAEAGDQVYITFKMKNTAPIRGLQFDLYLPEGVTLDKTSAALSSDRLPSGDHHAIEFTDNTDYIQVLINSSYDDVFVGEDGTLFTAIIDIANTVSVGDHPIYLKAMKLSETDISKYYTQENIESTLTITGVSDGTVKLNENSETLPIAQSNVSVKVIRTIKGGQWNTICLPFEIKKNDRAAVFGGSNPQVAKVSTVDVATSGDITINCELVSGKLSANTPYLIMPEADVSELTASNVNIVVGSPATELENDDEDVVGSFYGTLKAGTVIPKDNLFLSNNKFYYSTGTTTIKGFRGYFYLQDFSTSSPAPKLVINGEATNIDGLQIVDGDGRIYNLNGQHVENPTKKGVYIQNGKKVVIKK